MSQQTPQALADLDQAPSSAAAFDDAVWRALDADRAVSALAGLADKIAELHRRGVELQGVRRADLRLDAERGRLYLVDAPRMRACDERDAEAIWRDARLIGELAYECFMDEDYPGGHQMAALLQERHAMAETGLLQPGLTQLVAVCVSPYGELALRDMDELARVLDQLHLEVTSAPSFRVGAASTVGNYIFRRNNQDACGHMVMNAIAGSSNQTVGFFCVADGIGGIDDGERASKLAIESACLAFGRAWSNYGAERLEQRPTAFARAVAKVTSQRLALEGEFDAHRNRGGTTFTGLLIAGRRAGVCHVGDSRAMLARRGELTQLTRDHTLANILENLGEDSGSQAQAEMNNRTISRFLSTGVELEAERIDGFSAAARDLPDSADVDRAGIAIEAGDLFVLTSDGVHDEISAKRFKQLIALHRHDPQGLADAMVQRALSQVGRDNATALVVLVE